MRRDTMVAPTHTVVWVHKDEVAALHCGECARQPTLTMSHAPQLIMSDELTEAQGVAECC